MSPQTAKSNSDETNDLSKKEYESLLSVFQEFVDTTSNSFDVFEILEKLAELRADFVINHAIRGFGMDFETALNLVNNYDLLTDAEKERRGVLLVAIENLIDFAVVQEYQALSEIVAIMSAED